MAVDTDSCFSSSNRGFFLYKGSQPLHLFFLMFFVKLITIVFRFTVPTKELYTLPFVFQYFDISQKFANLEPVIMTNEDHKIILIWPSKGPSSSSFLAYVYHPIMCPIRYWSCPLLAMTGEEQSVEKKGFR